jgi:hypothetical protein
MITDTRYGNPFDAVARKSAAWGVSTDGIVSTSGLGDDDLPYLEAKGTQSAGNTVLVTREEVDHACANKGRSSHLISGTGGREGRARSQS